jgi:hypothetical protein
VSVKRKVALDGFAEIAPLAAFPAASSGGTWVPRSESGGMNGLTECIDGAERTEARCESVVTSGPAARGDR